MLYDTEATKLLSNHRNDDVDANNKYRNLRYSVTDTFSFDDDDNDTTTTTITTSSRAIRSSPSLQQQKTKKIWKGVSLNHWMTICLVVLIVAAWLNDGGMTSLSSSITPASMRYENQCLFCGKNVTLWWKNITDWVVFKTENFSNVTDVKSWTDTNWSTVNLTKDFDWKTFNKSDWLKSINFTSSKKDKTESSREGSIVSWFKNIIHWSDTKKLNWTDVNFTSMNWTEVNWTAINWTEMNETDAPSNVPTAVPAEVLTETSTTESPIVTPTEAATDAPTEAPIVASTDVPVVKHVKTHKKSTTTETPTDAPIVAPTTDAPTIEHISSSTEPPNAVVKKTMKTTHKKIGMMTSERK